MQKAQTQVQVIHLISGDAPRLYHRGDEASPWYVLPCGEEPKTHRHAELRPGREDAGLARWGGRGETATPAIRTCAHTTATTTAAASAATDASRATAHEGVVVDVTRPGRGRGWEGKGGGREVI